MRAVVGTSALAILAAGLTALAASAGATSPKLRELPVSYLLRGLPEPAPRELGKLAPLRSGVTYQAHDFPLALRLTAPSGNWAGAQWKSARLGFKGGGPPYFGWAAVGTGGTFVGSLPRGLVVITTAYARTPSVAKTVARLRARGRWATYQVTSPARVGRFSGLEFDGEVAAGKTHIFVPFTDENHFQDAFLVGGSEAFRVIVLNVRGKTVVVFIDSVALSPEQFPAFLTKAEGILSSLRFPS